MSLQDELKQIAQKEAEKNRDVTVDNFPDVQKVEVINQPEKDEIVVDFSAVEKAIKSILPALKKEGQQIDTEPLENRLELILAALSREVDEKDYSELLESIKLSIPTNFDVDEFFERLSELFEERLNLSQAIRDGMKGFTSSNWLPVVDAINNRTGDYRLDTSSASALANGANYSTGWVDTNGYAGIKVAFKTDQNGYFTLEYSPDQTNSDSTLTRYYRTSQIEAPHKFENMRRYVKVTFYNNSGSSQTYLRPDISLTNSAGLLNIPQDATMSQDYDAISVRPTNYNSEVALGRRQGHSLWNKFGYNNDLDVGTEVVASFGGTFTPLTTATTLTIVSTSTDDDDGGTGVNSIVVYGIDANRDEQIEVVTMNGTTNVVTTSTWLGINRIAMFLCGTGQVNAGTITITATTGGSTMAQMPAGGGVTQQCIFYVPQKHQFITEWLRINTLKQAAQNPKVTVKFWVYSPVNNGKQEVYKVDIDTSVTNDVSENPQLPFPITEKSVVWLEATTDKADTIVNARFSGILVKDVDA